jgi:hypothetical protein
MTGRGDFETVQDLPGAAFALAANLPAAAGKPAP